MFLRVLGRQCLILSSFRDGYGKVRQRRLASFRNRESLEKSWRELGADPAYRGQLEQLRARAESLLPTLRASDSRPKVERAVRTLLHVLATEPDCVPQDDLAQLRLRLQAEPPQGEETLQQKVDWERSRLSPRRRKLGPQSTFAEALKDWAKQLEKQGQLQDGLRVRRELAERCPGECVQIEYAAALQRSGQSERAIEVLTASPSQHPWRNFGLASAYWQQGRASQCLTHLLKALARDRQVAQVLDRQKRGQLPATREGEEYWNRFGDLWDASGREFLLCVAQQPVVRWGQSRRAQLDKLVAPHSLGWLLERAQEAAQGKRSWPYAGPHPL